MYKLYVRFCVIEMAEIRKTPWTKSQEMIRNANFPSKSTVYVYINALSWEKNWHFMTNKKTDLSNHYDNDFNNLFISAFPLWDVAIKGLWGAMFVKQGRNELDIIVPRSVLFRWYDPEIVPNLIIWFYGVISIIDKHVFQKNSPPLLSCTTI